MAVAAPPKAESKEETDKRVADLDKRLEALEKDNKELKTANEVMAKKAEDSVTKEAVELQVNTLLENAAELLDTRVRVRLSDRKDLDEDNVEEIVKKLLEQEKAFIIQTGGEQLLAAGKKGAANDGDLDEQNASKKEDTKDIQLAKKLVN